MTAARRDDRALVASLAANSRWAREPDRTAATAAGRAAFEARFEREVDPDRMLSPTERARRAESARKAYFQRMALASARSRRARRRAPGAGEAAS